MRKDIVTTLDCAKWPEFKAFARRLGIATEGLRDLVIAMKVHELVTFKAEYFGQDKEQTDENDQKL